MIKKMPQTKKNSVSGSGLSEIGSLDLRLSASQEFSEQNALFFAAAAREAYETGKSGNDFLAPKIFKNTTPKFTKFETIPKNKEDTEGFLMESKDHLVVVFCGTNSTKDWFQNIDTGLTLRHGSYIHDGFWKALESAGCRMGWQGQAA